MPYDNENNFNNMFDSLSDSVGLPGNQNEVIASESDTESQNNDDVSVYDEFSDGLFLRSDSSDTDYTIYLEDIISNQETIIANQEQIIVINTEINNNGYRLYYFVGGLYVAFAIIIMIKFFKTFLF